ncbi:hypothetical protein C8J57DRAFT_1255795 [Mycena rebaudengoi]|nr:hypothetical protein C8J57DRAFT_1255795 [Mycena rebaudengoi]
MEIGRERNDSGRHPVSPIIAKCATEAASLENQGAAPAATDKAALRTSMSANPPKYASCIGTPDSTIPAGEASRFSESRSDASDISTPDGNLRFWSRMRSVGQVLKSGMIVGTRRGMPVRGFRGHGSQSASIAAKRTDACPSKFLQIQHPYSMGCLLSSETLIHADAGESSEWPPALPPVTPGLPGSSRKLSFRPCPLARQYQLPNIT